MASYTVQALKFVRPQPELTKHTQTSTILTQAQPGWTAVANEDARVIVVKVKKMNDQGKLVTESVRYPFESIDNYRVTATAVKLGDEPADPK